MTGGSRQGLQGVPVGAVTATSSHVQSQQEDDEQRQPPHDVTATSTPRLHTAGVTLMTASCTDLKCNPESGYNRRDSHYFFMHRSER